MGVALLPGFAVEQRAGLLDFLAVYEQQADRVQETAMEAALRQPEWAAVMHAVTADRLVEQLRRARTILRHAVREGDWQSYIDHMRLLGARAAELGGSLAGWYAVARMFQHRMTPALVDAYAATPSRLTAALTATGDLLAFSMALIAEHYVDSAQHDRFRILVDNVKDYAIYMLDACGVVTSWNAGAQAITGYEASEIVGQDHAVLFPAAAREAGAPMRALAIAAASGRFEDAAPRVRKDGSQFWAEEVVTAIRGTSTTPIGYATVVRDLTERKRIEATLEHRSDQLEESNRDLEAFSYSVAHDLRAPLRAMNGFAQILLEDHAAQFDPEVIGYLKKIQANATRMGSLIDALLGLAKLSRSQLHLQPINVSAIARSVVAQLMMSDPRRTIDVTVEEGLRATADGSLVRTVLENLIGNAWKFTGHVAAPRIAVGNVDARTFFVRDNGAGFDMEHAGKLFAPFERIHTADQFPGTGIGLATVKRIVHRHGGRIWVTAQLDAGATFFFTLAPAES